MFEVIVVFCFLFLPVSSMGDWKAGVRRLRSLPAVAEVGECVWSMSAKAEHVKQ